MQAAEPWVLRAESGSVCCFPLIPLWETGLVNLAIAMMSL
jgi:hypothetical protein